MTYLVGYKNFDIDNTFFHVITSASYTPLKGPKARTCRAANSSEHQPQVFQVRAVSVMVLPKSHNSSEHQINPTVPLVFQVLFFFFSVRVPKKNHTTTMVHSVRTWRVCTRSLAAPRIWPGGDWHPGWGIDHWDIISHGTLW